MIKLESLETVRERELYFKKINKSKNIIYKY